MVRKVWDENSVAVFVTNDEQFHLLQSGKDAVPPIGFHRENVFKFDPFLAQSMDALHKQGEWKWDKLLKY